MTKKLWHRLVAGVLALCMMAILGCTPQDQPTGSNPSDAGKLSYADLYENQPVKAEPLSGAALYKASYGYVLSSEQGYNGFYYQFGSSYADMAYADGVWSGGDAKMKDGVMTPGKDAAVRAFQVPVTAKAHIYGNPYLVGSGTAKVTIYNGDTKLWEGEITDTTGLYHSHTIDLTANAKLYFVAEGAEVYWNPTVDFTLATETSLHHTVDGYYGDVHPFYDVKTGKLYMYYLSTGLQKGDKVEQFTSLLTVSDNMLSYSPVKLQMDKKAPPEITDYFALGVYVDKDGRYRSSYGRGVYAGGSVSDDLITWCNGMELYIDDADGLLKYTYRADFTVPGVISGRDPDITYDPETNQYYCVVMNYYTNLTDKGRKCLALYVADENGRYGVSATELVDFTNRGDPECPQLKKIGDRWYLLYSVWGTGTAGNVGCLSYRVGDAGVTPDKVDWNSKPEYTLEGGDLHAAQICQAGDMWYLYGWLNYTPHMSVWGGYLNMAREVFQRADGTLGTRCDDYLTELLKMGRMVKFADIQAQPEATVSSLEGSFGRSWLEAKITLPESSDYAVFQVGDGSDTYYVGLAREKGELYLSISQKLEDMTSGCRIKLHDPKQTEFHLQVSLDGPFIEAYVNDEYSVTSHTKLSASYSFKLMVDKDVTVTDAEVCKLADLNNIFD